MNIHQRRRVERAAIIAAEEAAREQAAAPVAVEAYTKASLGKMGKDELENLGRSQFNIEMLRAFRRNLKLYSKILRMTEVKHGKRMNTLKL